MDFRKRVVLICLVFVYTQAVKLPSYFTPCRRDDSDFNECIRKTTNNGIKEFVRGDANVHVLPLNPLHVPVMYLDVNGNLKINITDANIYGLEEIKMENTEWNFDKKQIVLNIKLEKSKLIGNYEMNGKILILPINGKGPCNITYTNGLFNWKLDYDIEKRKNKEYIDFKNSNFTFIVDRAYYQFENLFNGNKQLGDDMNKFLDENWKDVHEEVGVSVGKALGETLLTVLRSFFNKVSTNELWI